jgi:Carboxypeptidase regulatory-like domain
MVRQYPFLWPLVIACVLLQSPLSDADTCVLYHKRAPVKAACGTVIDPIGERLKDVELTLTDEKGSVVFRTHSDAQGKFLFRLVPQGDYTLHATAKGYHEVQRDIRLIRTGSQSCHRKIAVTLGTSVCDSGTNIKGIDKPSDLDADCGLKK